MSQAATMATIVFVGSVVAMVLAIGLWILGVDEPFTPDLVMFPIVYLCFAGVGALVVARRPGNPIGLLSLLAGAAGCLAGLADSYARLAAPAPAQPWAGWLAAVGFPSSLGPILLVVLLFPTGRLASRRWRIVATSIVVGTVLVAAGNAFTPTFGDFPDLANPMAVGWFAGSPLEHGGVGWLLVVFGAVATAVGLVTRLRRATGTERQQLKWMTYAASIQGVAWLILLLDLRGLAGEISQAIILGTLALIPIAAGIAILRYRLYDIDIVIRRTLVYGLVLGVLGAVYASLIVALQWTLSAVTGGGTLPVALSTLAIAALFGPVRRRVRQVVDRRFYRSRYDAQRTLEAFGVRLRDEVELNAVAGTLVATAGDAMRPAVASVWLRPRSR